MLVYDITNERSFQGIKNWMQKLEIYSSPDVETILIGNKCEMNIKRVVSKEMGEEFAMKNGMKFMETDAKSSVNVEEAFFSLATAIKSNTEKKLENPDQPIIRSHQLGETDDLLDQRSCNYC